MLPKQYTPKDVLDKVWNHRWMIAAFLALGSFAGLMVSASLPDFYQSDMLIQIVPQRVPDNIVRSTITMRTEDRIQEIEQQAKSRTRLAEIIRDLNLYEAERSRRPIDDLVEVMRRHIQIEVIRGDRDEPLEAFYVRFQYTDAAIAAQVTGRLGSLFVDENARERGRVSQATNEFLERQLGEARARLEAQERKLEKFRERYSGRLPSQVTFNMQTIQSAQLQIQSLVESTARDRDRKLMLERLYNDAAATPPPAPPVPAGDPVQGTAETGTVQEQLEAARAALARLELRLWPEHPDVLRAKRVVEDLAKKAEGEAAHPSTAPPVGATRDELQRLERLQQMRAEVESLGRQIKFKEESEQRLRATVAEYQRRLEAVPGTESEWAVLTRDYDTTSAAYKDLLTKSESSKVSADLDAQQIGEQFRVLDPPRVPVRPISPIRWQINAAAAGVGLFIGLGLTGLLELRDTSYHTVADVRAVLALPVVALVPYIESASDRLQRLKRQRVASTTAAIIMIAGAYVFWTLKLWRHIV